MRKSIAAIILTAFLANTCVPPSYAQTVLNLPVPGTVVNLSQAFSPVMIKGINVHPENAMMFDFIVDPGQSGLGKDTVGAEATKLIKYFMAALAVPEDDLWVNLSPYENDRIVPEALGQTEMGRDMLAQDYLLKQITASLIDPQNKVGKEFWDSVYKESYEKYGTTDIPVDTFNKVWIMPAKAVVYENKGQAVVVESSLKVMLETDYLASQGTNLSTTVITDEVKNVLREIVIPVLEKEVNTGKNFSSLRQVYNSLVLAHWFRANFKRSILHKIYADRSRIKGVDVDDKEISQKIYSQYVDSFKKGVYNYVKEEYDPFTQELIPRKYFSGGETFNRAALDAAVTTTSDASQADKFSRDIGSHALVVQASFVPGSGKERWTKRDIVNGLIYAGFFGVGARAVVDTLAANTDVSFRRVIAAGGVLAFAALVWLWEHRIMKKAGLLRDRKALRESIQKMLKGLSYSPEYSSIVKAGLAVQGHLSDRTPAGEAIVALADLLQERDPEKPLVQWDATRFFDLSADEQQMVSELESPFVFKGDMSTSMRLAELQWVASESGEKFQDFVDAIKRLRAEKINAVDNAEIREELVGSFAYDQWINEVKKILGSNSDKKVLILINGNQSSGKTRFVRNPLIKGLDGMRVGLVEEDAHELNFQDQQIAANVKRVAPLISRKMAEDDVVVYDGINSFKIYREIAGQIRESQEGQPYLVLNLAVNRAALGNEPDVTISYLKGAAEGDKAELMWFDRLKDMLSLLASLPDQGYAPLMRMIEDVQKKLSDGLPVGELVVDISDRLENDFRGTVVYERLREELDLLDNARLKDFSLMEQGNVRRLANFLEIEGQDLLAEKQRVVDGIDPQDFVGTGWSPSDLSNEIKRLRARHINKELSAAGLLKDDRYQNGVEGDVSRENTVVKEWDFGKAGFVRHDGAGMPTVRSRDFKPWKEGNLRAMQGNLFLSHDGDYVLKKFSQMSEADYGVLVSAVQLLADRLKENGYPQRVKKAVKVLIPKLVKTEDGLALLSPLIEGNILVRSREIQEFEAEATSIAGKLFDTEGYANYILEESTGDIVNIDMIHTGYFYGKLALLSVLGILDELGYPGDGDKGQPRDIFYKGTFLKSHVDYLAGQLVGLNEGRKAKARIALREISETSMHFGRAARMALSSDDKAETVVDLDKFIVDPSVVPQVGQPTVYFSKDGKSILKVFDTVLPVPGASREVAVTGEHITAMAGVLQKLHDMFAERDEARDVKFEVPEVVMVKGGGRGLLYRRIIGPQLSWHYMVGGGSIHEYMRLMVRMTEFIQQVGDLTSGLQNNRHDGVNYLQERVSGEFYNTDPVNMNELVRRMGLIRIRQLIGLIRGVDEEWSLFKKPEPILLEDVKALQKVLAMQPLLAGKIADALEGICIFEKDNERVRKAALDVLKDALLKGNTEAQRAIRELVPVADEEMMDGNDMPMVFGILEAATSMQDQGAFQVVREQFLNIQLFLSAPEMAPAQKNKKNNEIRSIVIKTLEQSAQAVPAAGKFLKEFQVDHAEAHVEGGIDFKAKNMNVDVKGEGIDFQLPEDMRGMDLENIEGLTPVIMNIIPVQNMSAYLLASS